MTPQDKAGWLCDFMARGSLHASAQVVVVGAGIAGRTPRITSRKQASTSWSWKHQTGSVAESRPTKWMASCSTGVSSSTTVLPGRARVLDHEALELRPFFPGAVLSTEAGPAG